MITHCYIYFTYFNFSENILWTMIFLENCSITYSIIHLNAFVSITQIFISLKVLKSFTVCVGSNKFILESNSPYIKNIRLFDLIYTLGEKGKIIYRTPLQE